MTIPGVQLEVKLDTLLEEVLENNENLGGRYSIKQDFVQPE